MDISNPLYKNQCIHVDVATFTVENGNVKVLLVQRKIEPYEGEWILPGGAVYNNESTDEAAQRELSYKTGLKDVVLKQFHAFSDPHRDPRMRMISISYIALIDKNKVEILQKTPKTLNAGWFDINNVPNLAFDHNEILARAIIGLKKMVNESNMVKDILEPKFTMPELQKVYEVILNKKFDRRNFRRKFLSLGLIRKTGIQQSVKGHRPAEYYEFIDKEYKEIEIF